MTIATNESGAAYHILEERNDHPTLSSMSNNNNNDGGVFLPVLQAEATATADEEPAGALSHSTPPSRTTAKQSFIHLLKGYVGPGCLSLPWALSQLGVGLGSVVIFVVAYWTSYNIWHIVELKRLMEREQQLPPGSSISYAQVGGWLYGTEFQRLVLVSVCVQQVAVCTVFCSFIGTNVGAALGTFLETSEPSRALVIGMSVPAILLLVSLPNLKVLAPVMALATISLFAGFGLLGLLVADAWEDRPNLSTSINWSQVPLAVCAILYSFEGICLILPIESSMQDPTHFRPVFGWAMALSALIFAAVASLCVAAFGQVTSGSITAFLMETQHEDERSMWILYVANSLLSLAVLLTYPLQLFPTYELVGPWALRFSTKLRRLRGNGSDDDDAVEEEDGILRSLSMPQLSTVPEAETDHPREEDKERTEQIFAEAGSSLTAESSTLPSSSYSHGRRGHLAGFCGDLDYYPTKGDSPQLRALLVGLTVVLAIAIPNVELLVSLAGALSGSATGLIIPPLLQLAHFGKLQREQQEQELQRDQASARYYWCKRLENYILLALGILVMLIGTGAALADIVRVYLGLDSANSGR
jgi:amino acid permease